MNLRDGVCAVPCCDGIFVIIGMLRLITVCLERDGQENCWIGFVYILQGAGL